MKVKEIRDLIDFLSNSGLEEVNIETEEFKIKVKRSNETQIIEKSVASMPAAVAAPVPVAAAPAPAAAPAAAPAPAPAANNYIEIKSPMIGTFYRSANPESPEFVSVGDKVDVGNPVCIIEAMKLFNEIESEVSGTIVKVLVENAQPVEYDQPLFLVDPS
ncbi:acetyl-CoA carboxylase biotin carboxyl carrier protein [Gilvimarinus agarilyticus]|uniref:acetyl-CoA carboxylase biotin carboxyl carrier protein n=1 Tax=Reichenbachiella TaxID=156993 RepID=UPI000E6C8E84|nr:MULTISPECIES: acetyl-CoA carboxylase biotin carboxyl carrier protein [Reichenbachiella]MBU2885866.1 acetyl-CoA carboxylase biotin carboxyl carrier protein [Gilvimarinus agarilyticus]MBU2915249.1 acetyl-CoA carboxylase biotin carboxyl carrier protein [Reichenbachiella agariperforans]RJE70911.1 acetyl-CoA carboxylase, biotin carboxyl carrier protein [Reichenbachiella sp. MSK19-1]